MEIFIHAAEYERFHLKGMASLSWLLPAAIPPSFRSHTSPKQGRVQATRVHSKMATRLACAWKATGTGDDRSHPALGRFFLPLQLGHAVAACPPSLLPLPAERRLGSGLGTVLGKDVAVL